jgi:hypothetical protein
LIDVTSFRIDEKSIRESSTHEKPVEAEIPDHPLPCQTETSFAAALAVLGTCDGTSNRSASI